MAGIEQGAARTTVEEDAVRVFRGRWPWFIGEIVTAIVLGGFGLALGVTVRSGPNIAASVACLLVTACGSRRLASQSAWKCGPQGCATTCASTAGLPPRALLGALRVLHAAGRAAMNGHHGDRALAVGWHGPLLEMCTVTAAGATVVVEARSISGFSDLVEEIVPAPACPPSNANADARASVAHSDSSDTSMP